MLKVTNKSVYLAILEIYFIAKYFQFTTAVQINGVNEIIDIVKNVCYIMFLMLWIYEKLVHYKVSVMYFAAIIILFIYFGYQGFIKGRSDVFGLIMCSLNFKKEYLDVYIKRIFTISILLYLLVPLLCALGILDNAVNNKMMLGILFERAGYGYTYSGQFASMLIPLVLTYYYLYQKKINLIISIMWMAVNLVVFSISKTSMSFFVVLIFIFMFHLLQLKKDKPMRSMVSKFLIIFPCVCLLVNMVLLYLESIGLKMVTILDAISNHRLQLGVRYIEIYGVTLFGTDFQNTVNSQYGYQILDSEYTYTLVACGIIYLVLACILMTIIMYYIVYYMQNGTMCLIWVMFFINAIMNNGIFNIVANPFCILLFPAIEEYFLLKRSRVVKKKYHLLV